MDVLLADGGGYTRREGLRRLKERLENVPGATRVRYEPSSIRPRSVHAEIDVEMFLGRTFPRSEGRIEVLWRPRDGTDSQRVQWVDDEVSVGWHKDDAHPDLDTTHLQIDTGGEIRHEAGRIEVDAPSASSRSVWNASPSSSRTSDIASASRLRNSSNGTPSDYRRKVPSGRGTVPVRISRSTRRRCLQPPLGLRSVQSAQVQVHAATSTSYSVPRSLVTS